jgi:ribose/xylose/arabinose/galactoside ABC-type transport system permease subunit
MITFFDALTVACFIGLVIAFFQFTERDTPTLLRFLVSGVALAIANQLGNLGFVALGIILVIAAMGFGWLCLSKPRSEL